MIKFGSQRLPGLNFAIETSQTHKALAVVLYGIIQVNIKYWILVLYG